MNLTFFDLNQYLLTTFNKVWMLNFQSMYSKSGYLNLNCITKIMVQAIHNQSDYYKTFCNISTVHITRRIPVLRIFLWLLDFHSTLELQHSVRLSYTAVTPQQICGVPPLHPIRSPSPDSLTQERRSQIRCRHGLKYTERNGNEAGFPKWPGRRSKVPELRTVCDTAAVRHKQEDLL